MKNLFLLLYFIPSLSMAQLHDNVWLMGIQGGSADFGISELTFAEEGILNIEHSSLPVAGFADLNSCFSDSLGNLLAVFNGYWVNDRSGQKMKGGDSIWYETLTYLYGYCDSDIPQGGMFLPWPGHPDSLLLFYVSQGNAGTPTFVELASLHLQYAIIRLSGNGGLGEVTIKRHVVLEDTIQYGRLSACKHANGRDWWMMVNERNTNRWYRYLLDPNGLHLLGQQEIGIPMIDGLSQSAYSPNGKHYAAYNAIKTTEAYLDVYDFDRCNGLFENHRQIFFNPGGVGGVSISANSRYLYLSKYTKLYQYDLEAPDLLASEILIDVFDGYANPSPAIFYQAQLAPDNKIYICALGSTKVMHVIHNPDEAGVACQFAQHAIQLPVYNEQSLTSSPYFRLGPLDGSSCDTLGLDNIPVAWYRYQQDTLDFLDVTFHDLSYYEPTSWSWDFGDGSPGSSERHPQHQYDSVGVYQICLTVSNANATSVDHCKTLYLGVSSLENPGSQSRVAVSPNPFSDKISITLNQDIGSTVFRLYDQMGRLIQTVPLSFGITDLETGALPSGMYYWEVTSAGRRVKSGKAVKGAY